jgi:hypothetical protein
MVVRLENKEGMANNVEGSGRGPFKEVIPVFLVRIREDTKYLSVFPRPGVRSPAGAKDFSSSLCVQTGSGAHPASCTMGTGGLFPGGKARPGRDADHSPSSSAEVENV